MPKLIYKRSELTIIFEHGDGTATPFECRDDFWAGYNEAGQPRESLPDGIYTASAEEPPARNCASFGTFFINTGDARERVIHGGGTGLDDPFAPRQGWTPTLGCLRMQNEDGQALSRMIIDAGNAVELEVLE